MDDQRDNTQGNDNQDSGKPSIVGPSVDKQSDFLSDTHVFDWWVRAWVAASMLTTGIVMGNTNATWGGEFGDEWQFNWGSFFGGLIIGAIANVPFLILFNLGKKILANLAVVRGVEVAPPAEVEAAHDSSP